MKKTSMDEKNSKEPPAENSILNLYKETAPEIIRFVGRNNGKMEDAAQLMETSLTNIYRLVRYRNFQPAPAFSSFFMALCKKKWLAGMENGVSKTERSNPSAPEGKDSLYTDLNLYESYMDKFNLHLSAFGKLDPRCRRIISGLLGGESPEELAKEQNTSVEYLQRKKSECIAAIFNFIPVSMENKQYSIRQIAAYTENALEFRAQAAFEHALAADAGLRTDLEKYLEVKTSLRMQFEQNSERTELEQNIGAAREKYFNQNTLPLSKRKEIIRVAAVVVILALLLIFSIIIF